MKKTIKPLIIGLSLLGLVTVPLFAAADTGNAAARTEALQRQLDQMQKEIKVLQVQLKGTQQKKTHSTKKMMQHTSSAPAASNPQQSSMPPSPHLYPTSGTSYLPMDLDVPGQSFVSTGPYIGVPIEYSGTNLIINSPNINEDVSLLKVRHNISSRLRALGVPLEEERSHLLFSGIVEGQAFYQKTQSQPHSSDIDVTAAELDAYLLGPSSWTSALISFEYDNSLANFSNSRIQNSRVLLNKAFVTIGNFSQSPIYGTFGQFYVPFGTYSSSMVSTSLTRILARTKARAILLGYQQQSPDAFYTSVYVFKGDSHVGSSNSVKNGGVNLGYRFTQGPFSGDFGGGFINNMADSGGMQSTGNKPLFDGFAGTGGSGNETLVHNVHGANLRGLFAIGQSVDLLAEYVGATSRFNSSDMTLNGHGAKPQALNTEASYSFPFFNNKPSSIAVGYGATRDALAIGLPEKRYSLVFNTSFWRDTIESLEFRHDIDYSASSTSSGSTVAGPQGTGKPSNTVTAQFDMYF